MEDTRKLVKVNKEEDDDNWIDEEWCFLKDPWARSRLLYPNPVCLLTTNSPTKESKLNVMVVTWIMCADNNGGVIASINRKRFSALALMKPCATFTLSVPTEGMEPIILAIGTCSGHDVNKFETVSELKKANVPWRSDPSSPSCIRHDGIVAVMTCSVLKITDGVEDDHMTVFARINHAAVRKSHWSGKCFENLEGNPILSFLGSKCFARTVSCKSAS